MSPAAILPAACLLLIAQAMPAAESFRDDCDHIELWKPQMSWLSNPTAVAETTAPEAGIIRLRVPERRRGMKWVRDCAFSVTPTANILAMRYRAEHIQADADYAVNISAPKADTQPVALAQLKADGAWHVVATPIPLDAGQTRRDCTGIVLQVQSDDGGEGVLSIDWISIGDAEPAGAEKP